MRIAVLLATYNGGKYLKEQIVSILAQRDVEVEIFMRDDLSTDDTVEIAQEFLPASHIIVNRRQSGRAANNFFLIVKHFEEAQNFDYFAFADQDDIWLPDKLSKAVAQLQQHQADLYHSNLQVWDTKNNSRNLLKKDFPQKRFDYMFEGGSAGCTYVFSRSFFVELQEILFKTEYEDWPEFSHDWFTYFTARMHGRKVVGSADAEILYRIHDTNVHGQLNKFTVASVIKRLQMLREGYYLTSAQKFAACVDPASEEFAIYKEYCRNMMSRISVLWKYRFQLMRSRKKFIIFSFFSLVLVGYSPKESFEKIFNQKI